MNTWIRFKMWMKLFLRVKATYTIDIYLKSGAMVTVPNLESFSSKRNGTEFVEINWTTIDYSHKLHSINPSDISAIVQRIK